MLYHEYWKGEGRGKGRGNGRGRLKVIKSINCVAITIVILISITFKGHSLHGCFMFRHKIIGLDISNVSLFCVC